jgi:hypothetical protein
MTFKEFHWELNVTKEEFLNHRIGKGYESFFIEGLGKKYVDTFQMISNDHFHKNIQEMICHISKKNVIEQFVPMFLLKRIPKKWIEICTCITEKTRYNDQDAIIEWEIYPQNSEYCDELFCLRGEMSFGSLHDDPKIEIKNRIFFTIIVEHSIYKWIPKKVIETVERTVLKKTVEEMTGVYKTLEQYIEFQRK